MLYVATLLGSMFRHLRRSLAEIAASDDADQADESEMIASRGAPRASDAPFPQFRRALPVLATLTPPQSAIAMSPDETVAWDMLRQHRFSRAALKESGELEAYLALGVSPLMEARWLREHMDWLVDRYSAHPEGLSEALGLARETGDMPVVARALTAVDDAVTAWQLRDGAVLSDCLLILQALTSDRFEPAQAAQLRGAALETARRAAAHIEEAAPDSPWLPLLAQIERAAGAQDRREIGKDGR